MSSSPVGFFAGRRQQHLKSPKQQRRERLHQQQQKRNASSSSPRVPFHVYWMTAFCLLQVIWIYPNLQQDELSTTMIDTTTTTHKTTSSRPTRTSSNVDTPTDNNNNNDFRQWQQDQRRKRREEQRLQEIQQKFHPPQHPPPFNTGATRTKKGLDLVDAEDDDNDDDDTVAAVPGQKPDKIVVQKEEEDEDDDNVKPEKKERKAIIKAPAQGQNDNADNGNANGNGEDQEEDVVVDNDEKQWMDEAVTPQLQYPVRTIESYINNNKKRNKNKKKTLKTKTKTKHRQRRRKSPTTRENSEDNDDDDIESADGEGDDNSEDEDGDEGTDLTDGKSRNTIRGQQKRNKAGEILHSFASTTTNNNKKNKKIDDGHYYPTTKEEDSMEQRFDGYFKNQHAKIADWEYFPQLSRRVQEPPPSTTYIHENDWSNRYNILLNPTQRQLLDFDPSHQQQCLLFLKIIDRSPPPLPAEPTHNACDGYDGVLHIKHYDYGAASGTAFFQFTIGMLQWADQHNYLPWIHIHDNTTKPIWDDVVHTQPRPRIMATSATTSKIQQQQQQQSGSSSQISFRMKTGVEIGWAIDKRDSWFSMFPGKPELVRRKNENSRNNDQRYIRGDEEVDEDEISQLETREYVVSGTGVWEHYFMPPVQNGFIPGDKSCRKKPLVEFDIDHITPGIHANAPWAPRAWRTAEAPYIVQRKVSWDDWFSDQRRHASEIVERYIRFNPYMERRAQCVFPHPEFSLGVHIRHGDKYLEREVIEVDTFYRYAKAFVRNGGGAIYVATDSAKVFDIIDMEWPDTVSSHVVRQPATKGLTRNETAAFDLGVSAHRTNVEALTDLLALSKCTFFLHGLSALSEAVLYINPGLVNRSINLEIDDHDHMTPQYFVDEMMPMGSKLSSRSQVVDEKPLRHYTRNNE